MKLRPYQQAAVEAVYEHLRTRDDDPCVVIPTGGGKTPVIATICRDAVTRWQGRVLVLAHVRELLQQACEKLQIVCPEVPCGVYSAGLKRRDTKEPVIVAGIQSVHQRACELDAFDLVIVDEAHMLPADGDGMYRSFLADARVVNPHLRVIGFTATPFRMKEGAICTPEGILNEVCYEVGVRELIDDGYLSPLITKSGLVQADTTGLHVRGGEFVASEVEEVVCAQGVVERACAEIVELTSDRRAVLIFAAGVRHAQRVQEELHDVHGIECGIVYGEMSHAERDETLSRYRSGELRYLVNVNVLTVGFDAPHVDAVALLRPTLSPGLYYQMVGRGFRLHTGKEACLVLDFAGNVRRHGPVDQVEPQPRERRDEGDAPDKVCPKCRSVVPAALSTCRDCGFEFPDPRPIAHNPTAGQESILSDGHEDHEYEVHDIGYAIHLKRGADDDAPRTMRVDYRIGLDHWQSEWICFEHTGYPRWKAEQWWERRSPDPVPDSTPRAVELAEAGALCDTEAILVRSTPGERFDRIVGHRLGVVPDPVAVCDVDFDDMEVPF